jgi:hypothetical protein
MLDFAVHLGHRFLATHSQYRMAQSDEYADQSDGLGPVRVAQPAQGLVGKGEVRRGRPRWKTGTPHPQGIGAPANHDYNHHCGYVHDSQSLAARLLNALDVLPPEIERDQNGKYRRGEIFGEGQIQMEISE